MTTGMIFGLVASIACLVLAWPAVRRAGPTALPALLFWAAAITALTLGVLLVEQWMAPAPMPPLPQRGVAA
jgi:uncharacterized membrane protein